MTSTCTAPIALKHYFQRTHTHSHTHRQTHTHTRTHTHTPYVCCLKSALCGLILSTHTHSHARTHARTRILCAACSLLSADPWRALTVHSHAFCVLPAICFLQTPGVHLQCIHMLRWLLVVPVVEEDVVQPPPPAAHW